MLGGDGDCPLGGLPVSSYLPVLTVAGSREAPTVTTQEMLVGANSSTRPESKQTVVAEVKPQESHEGHAGAVPICSSRRLLGIGQFKKDLLVSSAKGTGPVGTGLTCGGGQQRGEVPAPCRRAPCSLTPPPRDRYSVVRPLLADLEQETRQALKTLYGFSEIGSRTRREAEPRSSAWEGTRPKFLNLLPLLVFSEGETSKATDFRTGRKRKVSGTIIHKAADVVHVHESKEVVGFQLVSARAHGLRVQDELESVGPGGFVPGREPHGPAGGNTPS